MSEEQEIADEAVVGQYVQDGNIYSVSKRLRGPGLIVGVSSTVARRPGYAPRETLRLYEWEDTGRVVADVRDGMIVHASRTTGDGAMTWRAGR